MKEKDRQKIKLKDIKKDLIYKVPEDFFAKLPLLIQQRVNSENRAINLDENYSKFTRLRIALLVIILLGVGWILFFVKGTKTMTVSLQKPEKNKEIASSGTQDQIDNTIKGYRKNSSIVKAMEPQIFLNKKSNVTDLPDSLAYANTEELLAGIKPGDIELYLQMEDTDSDEMNEDL